MNTQLTARMDSLIKGYEEEMSARARQDAELQQEVRMRSANIIAGIAIGAVFLSAFFLILIMRDITRSNRYRRQLEEANKRAEDLLVAREKLMLAITHDFKAPLGSIMGYTELLSRLTEDERQRFYLDNMKSSSEHLLKLVSDLLDFHRLDLNKAEVNRIVFNPAQLFEEIRVCFEPLTAAKGLVLQCHIAPELSEKYISDPLRIQQIVNNLLSNAVKFTQQGKITLTVGYNASSADICPSFRVTSNSFTVKGLCRHPAKPCSCKAFSSISLRAVTAITGILRACGMLEARNNLTRSKPLIAGICISVSSTSNVEERSCSISSSNCSQQTASMLCCFSMAAVRFS